LVSVSKNNFVKLVIDFFDFFIIDFYFQCQNRLIIARKLPYRGLSSDLIICPFVPKIKSKKTTYLTSPPPKLALQTRRENEILGSKCGYRTSGSGINSKVEIKGTSPSLVCTKHTVRIADFCKLYTISW